MMRKIMTHLGVLLTLCGVSAKSSVAAPAIQVKPHGFHTQGITQTSTNWSGYVMKGNDIRDVKASWTVPAAVSSSYPGITYSSTWVGEDGWNSNSVEQLGTEQDYDNVNHRAYYYSWLEIYPYPGMYITYPNDGFLEPGNVITAEVSYIGSNYFRLYMLNQTQGWYFVYYVRFPGAKRTSAEFITEAPWMGGVLPLADFVVNTFSHCSAAVGGGASVSLSHLPVFPVEMIGNTDIKASPGGIFSGDGFQDVWMNNN